MIDHQMPTPSADAGSTRMVHILRALRSLGWEVTFLPSDFDVDRAGAADLGSLGCEVITHPRFVRERLEAPLDVAWICRPEQASRYVSLVRRGGPSAAIVYDTVDLHEVRLREQAMRTRSPADRRRARFVGRLERRAIEASDLAVVVTPEEQTAILERWPARAVAVVPVIFDSREGRLPPWDERSGFVFVGGGGHQPNVDAVQWIVSELGPRLRDRLPGATISVAGGGLPDSLRDGAPPNVQLLGRVDDLTSLYDRTRVALAPLRYGAGMKGKVGEAMVNGVPAVTTPLGAEGYLAKDGRHLLVASGADELVDAAVGLHEDQRRWDRIAEAGRAHIEEHFSPEAGRRAVQAALARVRAEP